MTPLPSDTRILGDAGEIIRLDHVHQVVSSAEGRTSEVIHDLTLSVKEREFLAVVGPSGAGKTTLIRAMAGLLRPSRGTVYHDGEEARRVPPWLAVVFQDYTRSLFPWLTVAQNVGIRDHRKHKKNPAAVDEVLEMVRLSAVRNLYPKELSGGMQQRVAIARAIIDRPRLVLMDEPFASVDAITKMELEDMLLALWHELQLTVIMVTHDVGEAVYMGEKILITSAQPLTKRLSVTVDLSRPRDQIITRRHPNFEVLYERVLTEIGIGKRQPSGDGPPNRQSAMVPEKGAKEKLVTNLTMSSRSGQQQ